MFSICARLTRAFFDRDTLCVARDLIGKLLISSVGGHITSGLITETEAYTQEDPASHSFRGLTRRNRVMFGPPGHLYVYLIYGMHFCANFVTEAEGHGAAVLLRGILPLSGIDVMLERRNRLSTRGLTNGPGKLCKAFGLDRIHNGLDLCDSVSPIRIEDRGHGFDVITSTPRIGITKATDRMWRFIAVDA